MRGLLLAMALLLVRTTDARAATIIGAGANSCGAWTADRHSVVFGAPITNASQGAFQDMQWVVGFLSGIGVMSAKNGGPLDGMNAEGVWTWVDQYCQAHPNEPIETAAAAFYSAHPHR